MFLIRLSMFMNAVTLAQALFYGFLTEPAGNSCFYQNQSYWYVLLEIIISLGICAFNAFVSVPLFSMCTIPSHHQVGKTFKSTQDDHDEQINDLVDEIQKHLTNLDPKQNTQPVDLPDVPLTKSEVLELCNEITNASFTGKNMQIG